MKVRRRPLTPLDPMFREPPRAYTPGSLKPRPEPPADAGTPSPPAKPEPPPDRM